MTWRVTFQGNNQTRFIQKNLHGKPYVHTREEEQRKAIIEQKRR